MSAIPAGRAIKRETMLVMLRAALDGGEYRFARQAALSWLAAFPGDLEIAMLQAQAILSEFRPGDPQYGRAVAALESICVKDPFYVEAHWMLARAVQGSDPRRYAEIVSSLYAQGVRPPGLRVQGAPALEPWGEPLRQAVTAAASGQYAEVEQRVQEALRINPDLLLAAVIHLLADRATQEALTTFRLAQIYHSRWPECLPIRLVLAEAHLELGNEPEAVHLLHLCAAGDAAGQTPRHLWGADHPYRSLWPEDMAIYFDQPVPAVVAGRLGWNRLAPGPVNEADAPQPEENGDDEAEHEAENAPVDVKPADDAEEIGPVLWPETAESIADGAPPMSAEELDALCDSPAAAAPETAPADGQQAEQQPAADPQPAAGVEKPPAAPAGSEPRQTSRARRRRKPRLDREGTAQSVGSELERLAKKLKQPGISRVDGRFPVYVILTSQQGLVEQYGPQTTTILLNEMRKVAAAVRHSTGWGGLVYYPDDAKCTAQYGLTPVNPRDPWKVKNALSDLDMALRQRGEMIGALLIVGNDGVVPFHRLPNPTDDQDSEVYSDSPYATLDANYFVPEWPVGRLPGEKGPDASLLLEQLRSMQRHHARRRKSRPFLGLDWLGLLGGLFAHLLPGRGAPSFGYTAAAWRRSSLAVFRPIGAPHTIQSSPPKDSSSIDRERITLASLGYYNLHGLVDSASWYGQRDPTDCSEMPDYPVALAPQDLRRNGHAPRVIFSEACYGAHILDKTEKDSLALKFLSMGTLAVVGSTCTAYGSVNTPLIAADLLGHLFWQHLKQGRSAGEALMQAKIDLVREMNRRQGFLDGEDQKTLISFVLYGDPLATYDGFRVRSKTHRLKTHLAVKTVPDQPEASIPPSQVSSAVLSQVKSIVAEYLPGADLGEMHFSRQAVPVEGKGRLAGGNSTARAENTADGSYGGRMVVTVSKRVPTHEHIHQHIMRVTLDEEGRAVKLSISR